MKAQQKGESFGLPRNGRLQTPPQAVSAPNRDGLARSLTSTNAVSGTVSPIAARTFGLLENPHRKG